MFDKNVAFNTLLAIALPKLERLSTSSSGRWQRSSLLRKTKYTSPVEIVWIAKEVGEWTSGPDYSGAAEAHFVGTRDECLQFLQLNNNVPKTACKVEYNFKGGTINVIPEKPNGASQSSELDLSWLVTNELQKAVVEESVDDLPEGLFELDPDQNRILLCKPPLLLESRSGTGKTNCLFW